MTTSGMDLAVEPQVEPYRIQRVCLRDAAEPTVSDWKAFATQSGAEPMMQNPEWLRGYFSRELENLSAYLLYQSGSMRGVAPFLCKDWPLRLDLGAFTVGELPLRRLRLLGAKPDIPEDKASYDLLFSELSKQEGAFDAVYLEAVPLDSFLWTYLQTSSLVKNDFRMHLPYQPMPYLRLRFGASFPEYLKKFSSKQRNTLLRRVKKIREGEFGEMRFEQFTKPEEVDLFLHPAVEVSKKTYQWKLHNRGLSATALLKQRLQFAAEHGWMRCYVLSCGGNPIAFLAGYQAGGCFVLDETGFDPALAKYSAGTAMHLMVVEDLFARNRPEIYDLGNGAPDSYKAMLSTESSLTNHVFLFRPGARLRLVRESHRACQFVTRAASTVLERLQLKSKLRKMLRGQAKSG